MIDPLRRVSHRSPGGMIEIDPDPPCSRSSVRSASAVDAVTLDR